MKVVVIKAAELMKRAGVMKIIAVTTMIMPVAAKLETMQLWQLLQIDR